MTNPLSADLDHILDHTRELWEELRGERIFITGGTGFFGCWLLESLVWANERLNLDCRATVLSRSPERFRAKAPHLADHKSVAVIQGDVRTFQFPPGEFSHIIHAATFDQNFSSPSNPMSVFTENFQGTYHVLEFALNCRAKKFLFTSSGAVYGKQPPDMTHIAEEYSGAPPTTDLGTGYGHSKRASEFLCIAASTSGLLVKIARCFTFAGPYLPLESNYAIANFIRDALTGNSMIIQGDGTPFRSYLYTADLARWLWTILFKGKSSHPYNVGSDKDLTIFQLATEVVRVLKSNIEIKLVRQPVLDQAAQRYVPSIQRAKDELNLDVKIQLAEAIRRMANYYSLQNISRRDQ